MIWSILLSRPALIAALAAACAYGGVQAVQHHKTTNALSEARTTLDTERQLRRRAEGTLADERLAHSRAMADALAAASAASDRLEEIRNATETMARTQQARIADADARASAAERRMRDAARDVAAAARAGAGAGAAAAGSRAADGCEAAAQAAGVLADVLGRVGSAVRPMAGFADSSHAAATSCERYASEVKAEVDKLRSMNVELQAHLQRLRGAPAVR